ncbi:hypothetical protein [Actinoplanes friuliensis]|uniref:hypothetical protein n=1 Tax=Actinoplanes friuliensis TaxID=196914 RepID=UPI0011DCD6AF|nr:hypothetical protein [Actinoplanes friuliensis]
MGLDTLPGWTDGWAADWPGGGHWLAWCGFLLWPWALYSLRVVSLYLTAILRCMFDPMYAVALDPFPMKWILPALAVPVVLTWALPPFWSRPALFVVQAMLLFAGTLQNPLARYWRSRLPAVQSEIRHRRALDRHRDLDRQRGPSGDSDL